MSQTTDDITPCMNENNIFNIHVPSTNGITEKSFPSSIYVSPKQLRPYLQANPRIKQNNERKKSAIVTDTSEKALREEEHERILKKAEVEERKIKKQLTSQFRKKNKVDAIQQK